MKEWLACHFSNVDILWVLTPHLVPSYWKNSSKCQVMRGKIFKFAKLCFEWKSISFFITEEEMDEWFSPQPFSPLSRMDIRCPEVRQCWKDWIYENLCVLCEAAHKNVTNLTGRSQVKQFYGVKEWIEIVIYRMFSYELFLLLYCFYLSCCLKARPGIALIPFC